MQVKNLKMKKKNTLKSLEHLSKRKIYPFHKGKSSFNFAYSTSVKDAYQLCRYDDEERLVLRFLEGANFVYQDCYTQIMDHHNWEKSYFPVSPSNLEKYMYSTLILS